MNWPEWVADIVVVFAIGIFVYGISSLMAAVFETRDMLTEMRDKDKETKP